MSSPGCAAFHPRADDRGQDDGVIMRLITSSEDQSDATPRSESRDLPDQIAVRTELVSVPTPEFEPLLRVVTESLAQLCRRRELLHPLVDRCLLLTQASWPQPINEKPTAV